MRTEAPSRVPVSVSTGTAGVMGAAGAEFAAMAEAEDLDDGAEAGASAEFTCARAAVAASRRSQGRSRRVLGSKSSPLSLCEDAFSRILMPEDSRRQYSRRMKTGRKAKAGRQERHAEARKTPAGSSPDAVEIGAVVVSRRAAERLRAGHVWV